MVKNTNAEEYANKMEVTAKKVLKVIGLVILGIIFVVLIGFVVMGLWNWLMPMIFGLPEITYWQGIGLLILAKILFGGIGGSSDSKSSSSSPKSEISGAIGQAIHEEMQREFIKEFSKKFQSDFNSEECANSTDEASSHEKAFDTWWEEEGEGLFEKYMHKEK